jgi:HEPN domain-containing protein
VISASDDLRVLADERISEAKALLANSCYSGAYYLAGYAVEFGLKAIFTRDLGNYMMPDKRAVEQGHSHNLKQLAGSCGLNPEEDAVIRISWNVVASSWSPEARYRLHTESRSIEMVKSAEEVLAWLKPNW